MFPENRILSDEGRRTRRCVAALVLRVVERLFHVAQGGTD